MTKSTDDRGRIHLLKAVVEHFGDEYRIVEFPGHVALFPVDEDPIEWVHETVGEAFEGEDAATLKERGRERIAEEARAAGERDDGF